MGLKIFSRDWNDFAAEKEFRNVLDYFCRSEVGLRIFLSEEKGEEKFGHRKFLSRNTKGRKVGGLRKISPSKREKESKVKQVRRGVRNPVR